MRFRFYFLVIQFMLFANILFSQEGISDVPNIFYRNEKTVAFNLSTNGWGLGYRYGSRINYLEKRLYEAEFSIIKHSKEIKSTSFRSESFVFGKLNSVYDLRFGYGKQNEMFSKADIGSVAIRYFYTFGPSVAFLKPIYYDIEPRDTTMDVKEQRFNADIHDSGNIRGKSSFFKGFDEIKIVPGAFVKAGINVEFSQSETLIHALEAGVMVQAYTNSLEIMDVDDNQQFFFTLFVCYRFGKVVNAQEVSDNYFEKRKRKFRIFR
ncbi:MAG: hypothetical protein JEY96_08695 [Bacteroidales bacterium]|nr:hypothetical protein [Bacteroidales bacterium]